jgi:hypothetical protein
MGHHYNPRHYLRGFCVPDSRDQIWMYDKITQKFSLAGVKSVAQEPGYYSDDDEQWLSETVEHSAHGVLTKLRETGQINPDGRESLALYIGAMIYRVPHRRRKAGELYPYVRDEVLNQVVEELKQRAEEQPELGERLTNALTRLDQAWAEDEGHPPDTVTAVIRSPRPGERITDAIRRMTWRFVWSEGPSWFLTSDNPAYFFEGFGLGNPEAELVFPISSRLALHGCWQGRLGETLFLTARQALVKELNRRVASGAERFVFCSTREEWVQTLAHKPRPLLSRLQW